MYFVALSLSRLFPLSGDLTVALPYRRPLFLFTPLLLLSPFLAHPSCLTLSLPSRFGSPSHSLCLCKLVSSSSHCHSSRPSSLHWISCLKYHRFVRLTLSCYSRSPFLRTLSPKAVLVRLTARHRDCCAPLFFLFPLYRPRARELPDNFRFSAQWLGTATAQPAPRTRISTSDGGHETREQHATV